MSSKDLQELQVGGGATGASTVPAPVAKKATLPASNLNNGEAIKKIQDPNDPGCGETDEDNNVKVVGSAAGSNKASISAKPSAASSSMKEDVDALFNGEDLSEEFREKATTIFEAAVTARVTAIREEFDQAVVDVREQQEQIMEDRVAELTEELTEVVDKYLTHVAEQWLADNQVAVEKSLRTDVTEGFIEGLKQLFSEHYFEMPESRIEVTEEMAAKIDELEQRLNEATEQNIEMKRQLDEHVLASTKEQVFEEVVAGLADTQIEKLRTLAEGVEFTDAVTYSKKLNVIKSSYFAEKKGTHTASMLSEEVDADEPAAGTETKIADPVMARYASAISRTLKK